MEVMSNNEYELDRDRRIARNVDTMKRMGLFCPAADGLQAKLSTYQRPIPPLTFRPKASRAVRVCAVNPPVSSTARFLCPSSLAEVTSSICRKL